MSDFSIIFSQPIHIPMLTMFFVGMHNMFITNLMYTLQSHKLILPECQQQCMPILRPHFQHIHKLVLPMLTLLHSVMPELQFTRNMPVMQHFLILLPEPIHLPMLTMSSALLPNLPILHIMPIMQYFLIILPQPNYFPMLAMYPLRMFEMFFVISMRVV